MVRDDGELTDLEEVIVYKKRSGNDNIFYKEIIKRKLMDNSQLIRAIDNPDLDPECPEDYLGENILPYYLLTNTQTKAQNYICYETSFTNVLDGNRILKQGQIIFSILCIEKNIYDKETGIARHDLLAALLEDEFNWCTDFGTQLKLVSDRPYATDGAFVLRTLTFEQTTTNGIVDPRLGVLDENNIPSGRIITDER